MGVFRISNFTIEQQHRNESNGRPSQAGGRQNEVSKVSHNNCGYSGRPNSSTSAQDPFLPLSTTYSYNNIRIDYSFTKGG